MPPERIPWRAIIALLVEYAYGGRVDREADKEALSTIVAQTFVPEAFGPRHELGTGCPPLPEAASASAMQAWCTGLPGGEEGVAWLGLPAGAEEGRLVEEGERVLAAVRAAVEPRGGGEP